MTWPRSTRPPRAKYNIITLNPRTRTNEPRLACPSCESLNPRIECLGEGGFCRGPHFACKVALQHATSASRVCTVSFLKHRCSACRLSQARVVTMGSSLSARPLVPHFICLGFYLGPCWEAMGEWMLSAHMHYIIILYYIIFHYYIILHHIIIYFILSQMPRGRSAPFDAATPTGTKGGDLGPREGLQLQLLLFLYCCQGLQGLRLGCVEFKA